MKKRQKLLFSRILSILLVAVMLSQSTLGSGRIVLASPAEERDEEEQVTDASTMTQESDSNPSLSETRGDPERRGSKSYIGGELIRSCSRKSFRKCAYKERKS